MFKLKFVSFDVKTALEEGASTSLRDVFARLGESKLVSVDEVRRLGLPIAGTIVRRALAEGTLVGLLEEYFGRPGKRELIAEIIERLPIAAPQPIDQLPPFDLSNDPQLQRLAADLNGNWVKRALARRELVKQGSWDAWRVLIDQDPNFNAWVMGKAGRINKIIALARQGVPDAKIYLSRAITTWQREDFELSFGKLESLGSNQEMPHLPLLKALTAPQWIRLAKRVHQLHIEWLNHQVIGTKRAADPLWPAIDQMYNSFRGWLYAGGQAGGKSAVMSEVIAEAKQWQSEPPDKKQAAGAAPDFGQFARFYQYPFLTMVILNQFITNRLLTNNTAFELAEEVAIVATALDWAERGQAPARRFLADKLRTLYYQTINDSWDMADREKAPGILKLFRELDILERAHRLLAPQDWPSGTLTGRELPWR